VAVWTLRAELKPGGRPRERRTLASPSVPFAADMADGLDEGSTASELVLEAAAAEVFAL
jgi:hypothetical protein